MPARDLAFRQRGAVLLEGLLAILIFSFGILALVGLQASSMKATSAAKVRVNASLIANQRIAEMWVNRDNLFTYRERDEPLPPTAGLPNGKRTTDVSNAPLVTVTVTWQMPGSTSADNYRATADIAAN